MPLATLIRIPLSVAAVDASAPELAHAVKQAVAAFPDGVVQISLRPAWRGSGMSVLVRGTDPQHQDGFCLVRLPAVYQGMIRDTIAVWHELAVESARELLSWLRLLGDVTVRIRVFPKGNGPSAQALLAVSPMTPDGVVKPYATTYNMAWVDSRTRVVEPMVRDVPADWEVPLDGVVVVGLPMLLAAVQALQSSAANPKGELARQTLDLYVQPTVNFEPFVVGTETAQLRVLTLGRASQAQGRADLPAACSAGVPEGGLWRVPLAPFLSILQVLHPARGHRHPRIRIGFADGSHWLWVIPDTSATRPVFDDPEFQSDTTILGAVPILNQDALHPPISLALQEAAGILNRPLWEEVPAVDPI
jgi:hypothetical protein